jgi:Domain of unknown function (DUF4365)
MSSGRRAGAGTGQTQAFGMRRAPEHRVNSSFVAVVYRIFTNELGWNFTRNQVPEYGIDGHAAVVTSEDIITGRMLATQIKGGASRFSRQA